VFLAERVGLLLLLLVSIWLSLLVQVLLQRWWLAFLGKTGLLGFCRKARSRARDRVRGSYEETEERSKRATNYFQCVA
jgi:hypothetical protein